LGIDLKIELNLYASFKQYLPEKSSGNSCMVEAGEGTRVRDLLARMNIPPAAPKVIFLNGVHAKGDEVLKDGDRVGAFPPVAGG
jgi:molybdopterin converting factor small subunit